MIILKNVLVNKMYFYEAIEGMERYLGVMKENACTNSQLLSKVTYQHQSNCRANELVGIWPFK